MLRFDLSRAGIPYRAENGEYFDFHCLRVECGTLLALGGAHPAVMQQRLRHSRPELTMILYTKIRGDDHQAAVLQALPDLAATG